MTRKRGKDKQAKQGVPDEILAEGSGPNEVIEADAQALANAASEAVNKRRGRKAKQVVDAWGQPVEVSEEEAAAMEARAEAAAEAPVDSSTTEEPATTSSRKAKGKAAASSKKRAKNADTSSERDEVIAGDASSSDESADERSVSNADESDEDSAEQLRASGDEQLDADADAEAPHDADGELTEEAQSEQSLEDAVLRAEAEAELAAASNAEGGDDAGDASDAGDAGDADVPGAALPTTAASMDAAQLKNLVEALVFAADKPVTLQRLRQLTRVSEVKRLEQALAEIAVDYQNRGIALQQVSGGYQFRTNTQYSVWVQQLIAGRPVRLSRAQLETLAIVAYRQPITRPEVDEIRGVDSSATLRLLLDRSLIRVLGKKEDVGRPVLYGTTKEFLDFFSLHDLRELPTLREYSELTAESRKVMSDRLGLDANGNAVDEDGNPIDAEGNPIDDGTDMLPDAPVDSMAASDDPGSEDEAAIEAVSAVTNVIGIEEERIDTTAEPSGSFDDDADAEIDTSAPASDALLSDIVAREEAEAAAEAELGNDVALEAADVPDEEAVEDNALEQPLGDELSASGEQSASDEQSASEASSDELSGGHESIDQGMPRGSSQEDVLAISDDANIADAEVSASDDDGSASASGADDDLDAAASDDEAASDDVPADVMDASAPDRLDEPDKSPAE